MIFIDGQMNVSKKHLSIDKQLVRVLTEPVTVLLCYDFFRWQNRLDVGTVNISKMLFEHQK